MLVAVATEDVEWSIQMIKPSIVFWLSMNQRPHRCRYRPRHNFLRRSRLLSPKFQPELAGGMRLLILDLYIE